LPRGLGLPKLMPTTPIARKIIDASYQNSNAGYVSPEIKGLIKIKNNKR
jgi:hypothetical protein